MRENGIQSKSHKKYKATTNSRHSLPVAENILNRDFAADRPGQKMVSDITYIPTDEGWLYLAGVMDLCGDKIVGISMDGRMTKELVISALEDAVRHTQSTEGCILHSDGGKPVLLAGLSGSGKRAWICQQHEPKRELLGQCPDGELLGKAEAGMAQWPAFPEQGRSKISSI